MECSTLFSPTGFSSQQRFSLYRWHMDPVRFEQDIRVTLQDLGWRRGGRYLPRQDDFMSVAWYQTLPAENSRHCLRDGLK